jgi:hypothetical protein
MGTVVQTFEPLAGYNTGSVIAELYVPASGPTLTPGWAFTNPGTNLEICFPSQAINYGGGNATIQIDWYCLAATSGTATWKAKVIAVTPGDAESVEASDNATSTTSSATTVNGTAGGLTRTTISVSALDSMAAGDKIWIKLQRDTADTSIAQTIYLTELMFSYGDGLAGTPGSGDFVSPASSTTNAVVKFADATGRLGSNSGVIIDASNNVTGLGTINTRTIATLAAGPGASTAGRVATYSSTDGITLANGPRLEADLVAGPAVATDTALMRFSGTGGKTSQNSGITVDASNNVAGMGTLNTRTIANFADGVASSVAGNIASFLNTGGKALQDSGVSATAHAARHNPAGADAMFTGTWAANEAPVWNGTIWVPKIRGHVVQLTADFAVASGASTLADITGLTFALPRAGTFAFQCTANHVSTGTAGLYYYAMNYTGTVTRIGAGGVAWQTGGTGGASLILVQAANNALVNTTTSNGGTSAVGSGNATLAGSITVSTTGTLSLRFARANASTAVTIKAGACVVVDEQ